MIAPFQQDLLVTNYNKMYSTVRASFWIIPRDCHHTIYPGKNETQHNLVKLIVVDLSDNFLAGPLPADWSPMTELVELKLNTNYATNNVNFGFSGLIPASLGSLEKLVVLEMHENRFTGPLPRELGNLKNLQILDVAVNA